MPLIVLLFLMYYGMPTIGVRWSPLTVALIGFTLNIGAYNAAYLKTAYNGLEQSELDAAQAQGFSQFQTFRLVILPQVLRLSVPAMTNQVIRNIKDTSVAFLIQYTEFFARIQELASTNFQFFKAYTLAGIVYLVWSRSLCFSRCGLSSASLFLAHIVRHVRRNVHVCDLAYERVGCRSSKDMARHCRVTSP